MAPKKLNCSHGNLISCNRNTLPYNYLDRKPSITDTFNVEESIMGVCAVFVQGPSGHIVASFDSGIPDDWNSHVGVCLQTKWQDGNTNKENGDDSNNLGCKGRVGLVEHEPDLNNFIL